MSDFKFESGQLVHHKKYGYRGVILAVDDSFEGTEEWYQRMTRGPAPIPPAEPPKDKPWYHVLVHDSTHETYVAEGNLEPDLDGSPIEHPLVDIFFDELKDGRYVRNRTLN